MLARVNINDSGQSGRTRNSPGQVGKLGTAPASPSAPAPALRNTASGGTTTTSRHHQNCRRAGSPKIHTTAWTSTYPTPRPRRPCTPSNAKRPDVVSAPAQSLSHTWALLNDAIALASSAPWPLGRCLPATVLSAARPNRLPARPRLDTDRSRTLVHRTPPGRRDLRLGEGTCISHPM